MGRGGGDPCELGVTSDFIGRLGVADNFGSYGTCVTTNMSKIVGALRVTDKVRRRTGGTRAPGVRARRTYERKLLPMAVRRRFCPSLRMSPASSSAWSSRVQVGCDSPYSRARSDGPTASWALR